MEGNILKTIHLIKNTLSIILLLQASISNATTTGQAKLTAGLSADNEDIYKGMAIDYRLQSDSYFQSWTATANYDYSDAKNRPSAINGHQYLYNSNAISAGFSHELKTPSPFVAWNTGGSYRKTGEEDINGNLNYNWSSFTGPNITKNIRSDMYINLNFVKGLQFVNKEYTHSVASEVQLTKRLTGLRSVDFKLEHECWDYKTNLLKDTCRETYNFTYNSMGSSTEFRISMGQTIMNNQEELLYGFGFTYQLNSSNRLSVSSERRNVKLKDIVVFFDDSAINSTPQSSVSVHNVSYSRQYSRVIFNLDLTKKLYKDSVNSPNNSLNINEKREEQNKSVSANYLFSNKICQSCSLVSKYNISKQEFNNWASWMLGVKYQIKKDVDGLFSIIQTEQVTGERTTSINLQLNYDGTPALIGR